MTFRRYSRYARMSTSTLRGFVAVLSAPGMRWLFAEQLAAIELELMNRELPFIAYENRAYLVAWILGEQ